MQKEHRIDLYLRRNDMDRITGVTFIDHETRCVFNGSRLGKTYSANALNDRFKNTVRSKRIETEAPDRIRRKVRRHPLR